MLAQTRHARARSRLRQGGQFDLPREGVRRARDRRRSLDQAGRERRRASRQPAWRIASRRSSPKRMRCPSRRKSFDAIVSLDAYQYFGTDDLYLGTIAKFLKPGGQHRHRRAGPDARDHRTAGTSQAMVGVGFLRFHSPEWWRHHWAKTGLVTGRDRRLDRRRPRALARLVSFHGADSWASLARYAKREGDMLEADTEKLFGFVRVVGQKGLSRLRAAFRAEEHHPGLELGGEAGEAVRARRPARTARRRRRSAPSRRRA